MFKIEHKKIVHNSAGFLETSVSDVNPASLFRRRRGFMAKRAKKSLFWAAKTLFA